MLRSVCSAPVSYTHLQFSPDGQKLLIATKTTPIYRHSYTVEHYIYPLKRNDKCVTTNNIIERLSDGDVYKRQPPMELKQYFKSSIAQRSLPDMQKELRNLRKEVEELKQLLNK